MHVVQVHRVIQLIPFAGIAAWEVQHFSATDAPPTAHVGLYCWTLISIAWSSRCAFGATFNKAHNSGVTCIIRFWENAMNLPIFQVPSCSAFNSSRMRLSIFSSGSRQRPQLAMGIQVLCFPGCRCKTKAAMPWLDTLVSIRSSSERSAFSQRGTLMTCRTTSQMHSSASSIHGRASWPKSWRNGLTNLGKAGMYSL